MCVISTIPLKMSTFTVKHAANYCSINLIFPNSTKCLLFLHDKQSVLCMVKSEFLYIIIGRILELEELVLQLEII